MSAGQENRGDPSAMGAAARWVQPEAPRPEPTPDDAEFFAAAARGEFVLQCCPECETTRHPPRPMCPRCHAPGGVWQAASGRGAIYTWTVVHGPTLPAFVDELPYIVIDVQLDEGPHMIGRLRGCTVADVRAGRRVEVVFEPGADGLALISWRCVD